MTKDKLKPYLNYFHSITGIYVPEKNERINRLDERVRQRILTRQHEENPSLQAPKTVRGDV